MASGKETPRQKMIAMMYLVLTAMLALNVSKEILDAFVLVNDGLLSTNINFSRQTDSKYAAFDNAKRMDEKKVRANWEKAQQVKKMARELDQWIAELKTTLLRETEGVSQEVADTLTLAFVDNKDDMNVSTNFMIGNSEDGSNGASRELKNRLKAMKSFLESLIDPVDKDKMKIGLETKDPAYSETNENWELYNFYDLPLVAVITNLTRIQSDVKKAEYDVVEYLYKKVYDDDYVFDTIAARVIAPTSYVLLGEEYKADVFLAAFNKTKNPSVYTGDYDFDTRKFMGRADSIDVQSGMGKYSVKTTKEGIAEWGGEIVITSPKGEKKIYPFKSQYIVAKPAVSISPTMMNVFYKGVPNPVSISVPGVPLENLQVSMDGGVITKKSNGQYEVTLSRLGTSKVSVSAKMPDGTIKPMGTMDFRSKPLPDPIGTINGIKTNRIPANLLQVVPGPTVTYPEDFVFNVKPVIKSFRVSTMINGTIWEEFSPDGKFTPSMKSVFKSLKNRTAVVFEDVVATGPDGLPRKINFTITIVK